MNAAEHRCGAGVAIGTLSALQEIQRVMAAKSQFPHSIGVVEFNITKVAGSTALAASLGTLPDIIEPATSPNHRQFFHSLAFAGMLGWGLYELWQWTQQQRKAYRFYSELPGSDSKKHNKCQPHMKLLQLSTCKITCYIGMRSRVLCKQNPRIWRRVSQAIMQVEENQSVLRQHSTR